MAFVMSEDPVGMLEECTEQHHLMVQLSYWFCQTVSATSLHLYALHRVKEQSAPHDFTEMRTTLARYNFVLKRYEKAKNALLQLVAAERTKQNDNSSRDELSTMSGSSAVDTKTEINP